MKIFKEDQRFTQLWLIILLAISTIIPMIIVTKEYVEDKMSLNEYLIITLILLTATLIIFVFKLTTRIDEFGIHYQFFPFHLSLKLIPWKEIEKVYVREYSAITEYGGWGLKGGFSKKSGKAINVKGNIGIQLELKNGKKLLIGTQKKQKAESVLQTYNSKINS